MREANWMIGEKRKAMREIIQRSMDRGFNRLHTSLALLYTAKADAAAEMHRKSRGADEQHISFPLRRYADERRWRHASPKRDGNSRYAMYAAPSASRILRKCRSQKETVAFRERIRKSGIEKEENALAEIPTRDDARG